MKNILVFGGVSYNLMIEVDEFPDPVPQTISAKNFHEAIGSTGAGKSFALQALGMNFTFHGIIGEDKYGFLIGQRFAEEGINFVYDICTTGTERHVNLHKNATGQRLSLFLTSPPEDVELDEDRIERLIQKSDVLFYNIAPYCKRFLPLVKKHRKQVWCDLHSYAWEKGLSLKKCLGYGTITGGLAVTSPELTRDKLEVEYTRLFG
ncbi:MAG: PfkB family carbohydrate kinase [Spirochaetia bacterium]